MEHCTLSCFCTLFPFLFHSSTAQSQSQVGESIRGTRENNRNRANGLMGCFCKLCRTYSVVCYLMHHTRISHWAPCPVIYLSTCCHCLNSINKSQSFHYGSISATDIISMTLLCSVIQHCLCGHQSLIVWKWKIMVTGGEYSRPACNHHPQQAPCLSPVHSADNKPISRCPLGSDAVTLRVNCPICEPTTVVVSDSPSSPSADTKWFSVYRNGPW